RVFARPVFCAHAYRRDDLKGSISLRKAKLGALAGFILAYSLPAVAGPIQSGIFYEFGFSTSGTPATGGDPSDPPGPFCIPSGGTPSSFLDAPPWTFVASSVGAVLRVTDAFRAGDRFQVLDFGVALGLTSAPTGSADCGDDPAVCLQTAGISQ